MYAIRSYYDSMSFTMTDKGVTFVSGIDYGDPSLFVLTSPQGWGADVIDGGQLGYLKTPESEDKLYQAKFFIDRELDNLFSVFSHVEIGANYTQRQKFDTEFGYYLAGPNGALTIELPETAGISDLSFIGIPEFISS